jgi:hypothetical protein
MSELVGQLARISDAFDRPTLRLLNRPRAGVYLAIFSVCFSADRQAVPADQLHTQVGAYLDELRATGVNVGERSGRDQCRHWLRDQWLVRTNGEQGEEYALTSHALQALEVVRSLSSERTLISESRLHTILDTARRWAIEANPDREARIGRLDAQIRELTAARDHLAAGGDIETASDEDMLNGYADLIDLISAIPSDFKRVEENLSDMHRQIGRDFRSEDRLITDVLDEYLTKSSDLIRLTPEGRAFDGAVMLLRDEALLAQLDADLEAILGHPFSQDVLTAAERRRFRSTVLVIRRGIGDVLGQRARLSSTLREHIVNHDLSRDRELDEVLRALNTELEAWMHTARPRATVPVATLPPMPQIEHLRLRFYDPANDALPPPLVENEDDGPEPLTLEQLREQGGPSLRELRERVTEAIATGDSATVGELFNAFPADLRRPVEILGLLHLLGSATDVTAGACDDEPPVEVLDAMRPDGSQRAFALTRRELPTDAAEVSG